MDQLPSHYQYLEEVSGQLDQLMTREQINPVLDELEFIYELLSPETQVLCQDMISTLLERYKAAS